MASRSDAGWRNKGICTSEEEGDSNRGDGSFRETHHDEIKMSRAIDVNIADVDIADERPSRDRTSVGRDIIALLIMAEMTHLDGMFSVRHLGRVV